MNITNGIRLVMAAFGIAGLTASSIFAWRDLQDAPGGSQTSSVKGAEAGPVLCYGLVDVESGVRRLAPAVPGRVKEIRVRENEEVEAGAVLLRLEDEPARLRLRQARAELDDAEKQLEDAKREPQRHRVRLEQQKEAVKAARKKCDVSRRQLERLRRWKEKELSDEKDVKDAADVLQTLEAAARIERARLEELNLCDPSLPETRARKLVEARRAQLELAENNLRQHELRAPMKGKVFRVLVGPGEFVCGTAGRPALEFCPDRPRIVRAEVGQEWASRLSPGQKLLLQDDENPEWRWEGEVRRVSDWLTFHRSVWPALQESHDQRTAECLIAPKPGPQRLRIGQKVRVMLVPARLGTKESGGRHESAKPGA